MSSAQIKVTRKTTFDPYREQVIPRGNPQKYVYGTITRSPRHSLHNTRYAYMRNGLGRPVKTVVTSPSRDDIKNTREMHLGRVNGRVQCDASGKTKDERRARTFSSASFDASERKRKEDSEGIAWARREIRMGRLSCYELRPSVMTRNYARLYDGARRLHATLCRSPREKD